ncbi:LapA family protein [candidate division KSB1 bacterium]|nr:LapA family protein [candidate division KSB1 bacterium]RQW09456.1 MAG: LapA family protein [candidate division KSB1 bacterium]
MWIIKWIVIVLVVIFLIGFAMQNADVNVPLRFLKWETVNDMPLWLIMYLSFVAGMIFWLAISIYQVISLKNESRRWRKRIKQLESELNRLRNVSVEDSVVADPASPEASQA